MQFTKVNIYVNMCLVNMCLDRQMKQRYRVVCHLHINWNGSICQLKWMNLILLSNHITKTSLWYRATPLKSPNTEIRIGSLTINDYTMMRTTTVGCQQKKKIFSTIFMFSSKCYSKFLPPLAINHTWLVICNVARKNSRWGRQRCWLRPGSRWLQERKWRTQRRMSPRL